MIYVVFLRISIFDHGLNVPLLLIHFWHGKYQRIGFGYISFHKGWDAIFYMS